MGEIKKLQCLQSLKAIVLIENPVTEDTDYRLEMLVQLRRLERLDKDEYTEDERGEAEEVVRFLIYFGLCDFNCGFCNTIQTAETRRQEELEKQRQEEEIRAIREAAIKEAANEPREGEGVAEGGGEEPQPPAE